MTWGPSLTSPLPSREEVEYRISALEESLKPCPFCGNTNLSIKFDDWGDMYIYCAVCDSTYENARTDKLIEGWNRRVNE